MPKYKPGLAGIVAGQTELSFIDGKKGILEYRGYNIKDLAKHSNFEEVAYLLWYGKLPTKAQLTRFKTKIKKNREINKAELNVLRTCYANTYSIDVLRTGTYYLAQCDPDLHDNSFEANVRKGTRLLAKFPTIVADYYRMTHRKPVLKSKNELSHGANFLWLLFGKKPSPLHAKAIEMDMLLTSEHTFNASTFTTRLVTSTMSDLHSAVVGGLATLKGPLHGGAREEVYKMLDIIKKPESAEKFVLDKIAKHQRIMGFGHRVYKYYDPRALIFKDLAKELAEDAGDFKWYEMSENIESTVIRELVEKKGKPIYPNVDFWTGAVYKYLGIPIELSTGMFSLGRISGWVAHIIEQTGDNRLIRPSAEFVGKHNRRYISIEKRK